MPALALTEMLGLPVYDTTGARCGRVRELALQPQEDPNLVSILIVRTKTGDRQVPFTAISSINGEVRASTAASSWPASEASEGLFLLARDLLDQQIIDVFGRKVVRVNDVGIHEEPHSNHPTLKVGSVDVGARGAVRRLFKGVIPIGALRAILCKIPARNIPWEFVDVVETDPARRVKLKISNERLAKLHPADIADIIEELAPSERSAVFETLNEELAAEALEEIDPKMKRSIMESLHSERAAEIVEEMDPDAAADLLANLSEQHSSEILQEMEPEERKEMVELLEFGENTAAGRMNTDYLSLPTDATVHDAVELLRGFEGGVETVSTVYLTNAEGILSGAVPLAKLILSPLDTPLDSLAQIPLISCGEKTGEKDVAALFDKYNLLTLPVVDKEMKLIGVITSDDVISMLRAQL